MKYYKVNCKWCNIELNKRVDAYKREMNKHGHCCCKKCFGKEPAFRKARTDFMTINNHFKGKKHSEETKKILSESKIGNKAWNKGLNKFNHPSIMKYGILCSETKKKQDFTGIKNPNWKGGRSYRFKIHPPYKWMKFRYSILKRDFNKCWKCNQVFINTKLHVHHLISRSKYPEYEYDEKNCVTLCHDCHKEFHKKFTVFTFTYVQCVQWINESRSESEQLIMC